MAIESPVSTGMPDEMPESTEMEESGESETLPMSLLGGNPVKPGDVVRIKVISVDEDNGVWDGMYAEEKPMKGSAIDRAAAEYDQMPGMNKGGI